ncbi:MAG: tdh 2 [Paenibacillus sp.]|jgi:2-desacetyl-2-hydroxyethyl bacteriochlorophyllide A dehydrogenase|nr:tdh 2 [Paenibacillus sp.]
MKGRAVVFEDQMKVVFRDVEVPEPADDDVVIDVEYSWISIGTESSFLRAERIKGEKSWQPGDPWPFPNVMGYQKTGIVTRMGSRVRDLKVGDHVFASTSKIANMFSSAGGHVSPAVANSKQVMKLPDGADDVNYSGMVLTQVGYNCGMRPTVGTQCRAVVIGDGLVGNWAAQTLKHRGADVLVIGRHDERLRYLPPGIRSLNVRKTSIAEQVMRDFANTVHIVVDSVGDMDTVETLWPFMASGSHLVSAGFLGTNGLIDIQRMRFKEMTLHAPSGWKMERMVQTLEGIREGWLQTGSLITHRYPVSQAAEAWQAIMDNKAAMLGVILEWKEN